MFDYRFEYGEVFREINPFGVSGNRLLSTHLRSEYITKLLLRLSPCAIGHWQHLSVVKQQKEGEKTHTQTPRTMLQVEPSPTPQNLLSNPLIHFTQRHWPIVDHQLHRVQPWEKAIRGYNRMPRESTIWNVGRKVEKDEKGLLAFVWGLNCRDVLRLCNVDVGTVSNICCNQQEFKIETLV